MTHSLSSGIFAALYMDEDRRVIMMNKEIVMPPTNPWYGPGESFELLRENLTRFDRKMIVKLLWTGDFKWVKGDSEIETQVHFGYSNAYGGHSRSLLKFRRMILDHNNNLHYPIKDSGGITMASRHITSIEVPVSRGYIGVRFA